MISDLGELVAEYCYGTDRAIPEKIVDLLMGDNIFQMQDIGSEYTADWYSDGYYNGIRIIFHADTYDPWVCFLNDDSWIDFILTGYNSDIYQTLAVSGISQHVWGDEQHVVPKKDFDAVRRRMIDASSIHCGAK